RLTALAPGDDPFQPHLFICHACQPGVTPSSRHDVVRAPDTNYLRFLVEDITVHGNEMEIRGKSESAIALLATAADPAVAAGVKQPAAVLVSVGDWLPKQVSNKNFLLRITLSDRARATSDRHHPAPTSPVSRAQARADEWRQQLESGAVSSRAALARREGVSRAYVTQVLRPSPLRHRRSSRP
ncbi:MAG: hypothetical protein RL701_7835, partial [Pseudomonadota bacterium]